LAHKDYDAAVALFRKGLALAPTNAAAHKDLAYTLLKTGDNVEARDEFAAAMRINPKDETAALEFAFLAFETKQPIEARRTFDRLRHSANATTRQTAETAFQNIDGPLAQGIARWKEGLARTANPLDPSTFSAHWELAQTAELRDEWALAAEQYETCRKIKPGLSELLLDLARMWNQLGRVDESQAALLAASRSADARTAERALALWGTRYPYPYEFLAALKVDERNVSLRKELAYLYLAMKKQTEAAEQFERVLAIDANDRQAREQLNEVRGTDKSPAPVVVQPANTNAIPSDPKAIGLKSLKLGYTRDAIRYLRQAHDVDPDDADVMLQLGWAYNMAKDDEEAIAWFDRARNSGDPLVAPEANRAFHNLRGDVLPQTTVWLLPMYSSRWNDLFTYAQIKRTIPLPWNPINRVFSLYLSTRFMGDVRSSLPTGSAIAPEYFSESSFIFAAGAASKTWHHLTGWVEAGEAVKYLPFRKDVGNAIPDYRGGLNFAKGFGHLLGSESPGFFYETTADAIYVSRFGKDWMFYWQQRAGRTFNLFGGTSAQILFNANYTRDVQGQYWANSVELGPGFKLHAPWMPPGVYFATDLLRGVYTNNQFNPRPPNYDDVRVGFWYARTK
jgi:tetratricopeptide (TPR) repeat protein